MTVKRNWQLVAFATVHALILLVLFRSGIYNVSSLQHDTSLFFDYSSKIISGSLPYRDFSIEYPPLALLFFILPRLAASTLTAYQFAFAVEIFIFDVLGLFFLSRLSERLDIHSIITLAIYTILILGIGPIVIYRYDLIPAVMVLAFLYTFDRQRYNFSWAILAIGTMIKIFPVVIAPVLLLYQCSRCRYREAVRGLAVFVITAAIIVAPGLLISPAGFWNSFSLQMHRGLHAESIYSSFLLLGQNMGLTTVRIQMSGPTPLSVDVVSSITNILVKISHLVMILALLLFYWLFYHRNRNNNGLLSSEIYPSTVNIINYSFLAVLIFLLTSNVFSPQFLIWLIPIAPLMAWRWRHLPWLMLTLASMLTYYYYPLHYNSFMQGNPLMVNILFFRNILLIALAVLLIVWKLPAVSKRRLSVSRFVFKPYVVMVVVALIAGSILFTQVRLNSTIPQGETTNQMPAGPPPGGGLRGIPPNGFPGGGPGGAPPGFPQGAR